MWYYITLQIHIIITHLFFFLNYKQKDTIKNTKLIITLDPIKLQKKQHSGIQAK